jgi:hypothetical protein
MTSKFPALGGGVVESPSALKIKQATVQLMCGEINKCVVTRLNIEGLIKKWEKRKILKKTETDSYSLSANGSWLIDPLFHELEDTVGHYPLHDSPQ